MLNVYLTFDDGPDPDYTPRILDALGEAQMHATFFTIGRQVERSADLVRRAAAEGHVFGNHTYSHRHPWLMGPAAARKEVRQGADALAHALGDTPRFFRPPHGRLRSCMSDEAQRGGQAVVLWDLSAIDWGPFGRADRIAKRMLRIRPHDIVLMHDGRNEHNRPDELLQVLPEVLADLRERGMRSVALR